METKLYDVVVVGSGAGGATVSARLAGADVLVLEGGPILEPLCETQDAGPDHRACNVQFLSLIKSLTADRYYTSEIGLMRELQYKGNTVLTSFPACSR
jgi:choline dehydrogenase-like flavoprotein